MIDHEYTIQRQSPISVPRTTTISRVFVILNSKTINGEISIEATSITELFSNKPREAKILKQSKSIQKSLKISNLASVTRITKSNVIEDCARIACTNLKDH